jgi:hypothetical protein
MGKDKENEGSVKDCTVTTKTPVLAVEDCLSCKAIGVATFTGIGLYALNLRYKTPVGDKRQRTFLACFAVCAFGVGSLRMFV